MMKWVIIGGALLILVWGAFLFGSQPAPSPMGSADPRPLRPVTPQPPAAPSVRETNVPPPPPAPAVSAPQEAAPPPEEAVEDPEDEALRADLSHPPELLGPVAELKRAFARAKRDAHATAAEGQIRDMFRTEETPGEMWIAATCRETVCRVELEWSAENALGYMAVLMRLGQTFSPDIATEPQGPPDAQGRMQVDVYVPREGYELSDFTE